MMKAAITNNFAGAIDKALPGLAALPQIDCPLIHRFTPGLYVREILMPAGTVVVSKVHKTEHPYVVLSGRAAVWTEESGVVEIKAPHVGITKPGTRRVLLIREECRWATFHPTNETDLAKIEEQIIDARPVTIEIETAARKLLEESKA